VIEVRHRVCYCDAGPHVNDEVMSIWGKTNPRFFPGGHIGKQLVPQ